MITVIGAGGLIGGGLCKRLRERSIEYYAPDRSAPLAALIDRPLGRVIYCAGVTADFRSRIFDTVEAHVCKLLTLLKHGEFDSLLYVSSTRVYGARRGLASESDELSACPLEPDHVYNLSKMMGEALALNSERPVRIVRISNVYGEDYSSQNFLSSVLRDAVLQRQVVVSTSADSAKDYIHLDDVVNGLIEIAVGGRENIYNLAAGQNVSNQELMNYVSGITGCSVSFADGAPTIRLPDINISRLRDEFGFRPAQLKERIADVVHAYQSWAGN
jgi:nucleoside-diphosphate-sugar epimerase